MYCQMPMNYFLLLSFFKCNIRLDYFVIRNVFADNAQRSNDFGKPAVIGAVTVQTSGRPNLVSVFAERRGGLITGFAGAVVPDYVLNIDNDQTEKAGKSGIPGK